ncbi:MAG: JAB domain-containing protein [Rhizobiaceae bacterium]
MNKSAERRHSSGLSEHSDIGILTSIVNSVTGGKAASRTAELMMREFGDLQGVLAAGTKELTLRHNIPAEVIAEIERLKYLLQAILRRQLCNRPLLEDLKTVESYFRSKLIDNRKEQFHALFLDKAFKLLAEECLQTGTLDHVTVYPREVLYSAIECRATHIILIHNHPAGNSIPSKMDITVTRDLISAVSYFGIHIADHIVIGQDGAFSFREHNLLAFR